jgi:hypothetical protein
MLQNYRSWLWTAVVLQLVTAAIHSISLFISPEPKNDTERRLFEMMSTFKLDLGAGFRPTFGNLVTALSACFSFLCLFGAMVNGYLLWKRPDAGLMRWVVVINLVVFAPLFVVMAMFTFLPPIVLTGLIFVTLLAAFLTMRSARE